MNKIDLILEVSKLLKRQRKQQSQQVKDLKKGAEFHGLTGKAAEQKTKRAVGSAAEKAKDAVLKKLSKRQQSAAGSAYRPLKKLGRTLKKAGKRGAATAATAVALGYAAKKYAKGREEAKAKIERLKRKKAKQ